MPTTIAGIPFITSSTMRTKIATDLEANSERKMATSTPIGTAISVAIETMIRLPTIASASPPASPKRPRGWVKKSMLSDEAPLTITEPITRPSMATAASADSVARTAKISWTIRRRRRPAERTVTSYVLTDSLTKSPHASARTGGRPPARRRS